MIKARLQIIVTTIMFIALIVTGFGCETTGPEVGNKAPDFTLKNLDGESITLSELQGKIVIVNFWATWCGPCVGEMPHIQAIYDERSSEDLVVLAVNIRQSATVAKDFVTSQGFTFTVLLDSQAEVAEEYQILHIPMTFFIDSEGIIKAAKVGAFQSKSEIDSILKSL